MSSKAAQETQIMVKIARRALPIYQTFDPYATRLDLLMDIHYAHHVVPLRLQALLDADDENFGHDIAGLYRHFDRNTKEFTDYFTPRFAK